jgi:hypothetical protein
LRVVVRLDLAGFTAADEGLGEEGCRGVGDGYGAAGGGESLRAAVGEGELVKKVEGGK